MSTERVDVVIIGSGFGGSITAWRLAELYRAAGADPKSIVVLERGRRYRHVDFRQSMDIDHLSDVYLLIQGQGAQVLTANAVGGGSNLYLAASLRAPQETFERRDRRRGDGPARRMWPQAISRRTLNPYYARAEHGLRVQRPTWDQVSKSGGLWAATLDNAGHTCDRVPLAISKQRCVNAKWCHTGCIFGAKNSLITNYLWAAENAGVQVRPNIQVEQISQSSARPYRYLVQADEMDNLGPNPSRAPNGQRAQLECKVLVVAAGAMGTPPLLMRSRLGLPSLSSQVGRNLGVNGDHVAAIEFDPARVGAVLGLPNYHEFYKGKPITTMSYVTGGSAAAVTPTTARVSRCRRSSSPASRTSSTTAVARPPVSHPGRDSRRSRRSRTGRTGSSSWRWSRTRMTAPSTRHPLRAPPSRRLWSDRVRDVQLRDVGAVAGNPRSGQQGDRRDRQPPRPRQVHAADRNSGRLLRAPSGRLPDGGVTTSA